jgi:uncharacterized tellurite resistance protein B-like protein
MLSGLYHFLEQHLVGETKPDTSVDPVAVAACALLLELAHADGLVAPSEIARIQEFLDEEFGLDEEKFREIVSLAERARQESVDYFHFTHLIRERLSKEDRVRLVEAIWKVVAADGRVDAMEDNLAKRMAELLGLQHPEVIAAKLRVTGATDGP